ncbi:hypothetical protein CDAR_471551 [Caerostris darwini]|uniref:Uncharacterized protein n=1 Tax=Caerostris darwini TaxID=1538125 RepID=A0AAV4RLK0_9ARAC|nr:hypothetical protein CDAR_471551 [Caerostris darwini]
MTPPPFPEQSTYFSPLVLFVIEINLGVPGKRDRWRSFWNSMAFKSILLKFWLKAKIPYYIDYLKKVRERRVTHAKHKTSRLKLIILSFQLGRTTKSC